MQNEDTVKIGDLVFDFIAQSIALVVGVSKYDNQVMEILLLDGRGGGIELAGVADLEVLK
tara:strand:- start:106 stop:285 length:180 start_codon:yes stop_codon:yes gene_type:complete